MLQPTDRLDFIKTNTTQVAVVAVFSALAIGTDYALAPFPNIKVMDSLVFVSAFLFGLRVGVGVGVLTWLVYGVANPWGSPSLILPFQIIGESFYAIAGALLRRTNFSNLIPKREGLSSDSVKAYFVVVPIAGVLGLITALAYDILTNTATWFILFYNPAKSLGTLLFQSMSVGLITMNFPLPLGIAHQVSDFGFFGLITPVVVKISSKLGLVSHGERSH